MFLFDAVVFLIAITLSIGLSVLISQPFNGAIVRLRANYLPKAVSLDNVLEDGAATSASAPRALSSFLLSERRSTAKIGPVVPGVFSMMFRTKRLEGWAGIYKGSIPVAIQIFTLSTLTFIFFSGASASSPGSAYKAGPAGPGQFGFFANLFYMLFVAMAALPLNVITDRYVASRHTDLKTRRTDIPLHLLPEPSCTRASCLFTRRARTSASCSRTPSSPSPGVSTSCPVFSPPTCST